MDPSTGPVQRFAFELRKLRSEAGGITYRVLAERAGYSVTTLSQAAAGEQLPTLPVVLAYAEACGGDATEWQARWRQATEELAAVPEAEGEGAKPPYQGLSRFETGDHDRFFGRDRLTADLLDLVRRRRFAAVFGPSGSGKSSLLRAGFVPALQRAEDADLRPAAIRILTPGPYPARALAHVLDPGTGTAATTGADTFVIVDQFEEIFTLCQDRAERARFLELLLRAREPEHRLRVLIAVRADFYGRCAEHRDLADALRDAQLLAGPMSPAELREVIVGPAAAEGLTVERALTSRLVSEVAGAPGGLPLLSHVLLETWSRRRGKTMTTAGYEAAGGLEGAIAKTAEDVYRRFTEVQAAAARRLLLRLVTPGEVASGGATPDTRRPAAREEVEDPGRQETAEVLGALAAARLLTLDGDLVELAHEALLTAWPRLRTWIDEDRERLRVHRELTEAARAWEELGRDSGALYRGTRLATAQEHFGGGENLGQEHLRREHPGREHLGRERSGSGSAADLTGLERAFLTAGTAAREQERHAKNRAARRLRRSRAGLSLVLVLAVVAGAVAWQRSASEKRERLEAEARRIVALADSLRATDPVTAMRLSIASRSLADLPESRSALMTAATQKEQDTFTDPDTDPTVVRHLSGDGRTLVGVGAERVVAWDVRSHRRIASWPGLGDDLAHAGVLSPDLRTLTLVDEKGSVAFWDVRAGHRERRRMPTDADEDADADADADSGAGAVADGGADAGVGAADDDDGAEIGPSGRTFVLYRTTDRQAVIQLRSMKTRRVLLETRVEHVVPGLGAGEAFDVPDWTSRRLFQQRLMRRYPFPDVQVSADDRLMALCLPGARLQIWDVSRRRQMPAAWAPRATTANCAEEGFQFTPDGRRLVLRDTRSVRTWEIDSGRELARVGHEGLEDLEFSPDGTYMAATDADEVLLWRTDEPTAPVFRSPLSDESVSDLRLDLEGEERSIRYFAGRSQTVVRSLSLDGVVDPRWRSRAAVAASFSPDGSTLAVAHQDARTGRATVRLHDGRDGTYSAGLPPAPCPAFSEGPPDPAPCPVHLAFRPDGRVLAYGVSHPSTSLPSEKLYLWDVPAHRVRRSLTVGRTDSEEFGGRARTVNGIVFHPDGTSLVTSRIPADERLEYWSLRRADKSDRSSDKKADTSGGMMREIPGVGGETLVVKPGGRVLATNHGQFLDLRTRRITRRVLTPGVTTTIAFSPDGRYLAAGDESGQVTVWDGDADRPLGILPAPAVHDGRPRYVAALVFSPDGNTLAAAGENGTLRLWDTDAARPLGSALPTSGTGLLALTFSPDSKNLYAAGAHVPLQSFDISTAHAAARACDRAGEGLTEDEWRTHIRDVPYRKTC
ncbi:nSTAND1 domain-containing NTPase [Streptomyces tauricus]|uniref:nSTAND1 domain-containing NTPase n=1 Tax=Streptomyces tauricus TaxID=68274 RepID=UPI0033A8845F